MSKPTVVAIYARVSTSEQNPEAQLLALREYAARRGFSIYKEYVDHVSGDVQQRRAKRQNDHAYRELMDEASRRAFDCVLVWKYDRFARSLSILVSALQQFSTLGIDFISYTQNIDTTTPMGRLFYHVIGSFADNAERAIMQSHTAEVAMGPACQRFGTSH
jgi:DNA invertase Pin-like site-specific DNA recombinase